MTAPPSVNVSYAGCVSSLRDSLHFLESSVQTLDNGVADFPRLIKVLKTVRVCFLWRGLNNIRSLSLSKPKKKKNIN